MSKGIRHTGLVAAVACLLSGSAGARTLGHGEATINVTGPHLSVQSL
jgi:hypothetical protein